MNVDDAGYFENEGVFQLATAPEDTEPVYGRVNPDRNTLWAVLLEKAWAKMNGNYLNTAGGFSSWGLRTLLGVPIVKYDLGRLREKDPDWVWDELEEK